MPTPNKTFFTATVVPSLRTWGKTVLVALAKKWVRSSVMLVAVLVSFWLVYVQAWVPLQEDAGLPAGVTRRNPELDVAILENINEARLQRAQHKQSPLFSYQVFFGPTVMNDPQ